MLSKENGAPAVTTQGSPDRTKLNAEIPIELRLETQPKNRDPIGADAAVTEDLLSGIPNKKSDMPDEAALLGIPIKKPKRNRVTKTGLIDRRAALLEIVRNAQPATVRQIFYLASVRGIVAKDEGGYDRVQIDLVAMRRSGGSSIIHDGNGARLRSIALMRRLPIPQRHIERPSGARPIPMSRFGWTKMRSAAWSCPSRKNSTSP